MTDTELTEEGHEAEARKDDSAIDKKLKALDDADNPKVMLARARAEANGLRMQLSEALREIAGLHDRLARQREETQRFDVKANISKDHIRDMRYAIKGAIKSIRNLAQRRPNEVTAEHLADLAYEAEKLVEYTDLPR